MASEVLPPNGVFTPSERRILNALLDPESQVESIIPEKPDPEKLWSQLTIACKAVGQAERLSARLRPVIGRMLLVIRDNPDMFRAKGYDTYDDFMHKGVIETMGLTRSIAYEARRIAEKWPSLAPERFAKIGSGRMAVISRFSSEEHPRHEQHLTKAEQTPLKQLREWAETKGFIGKGEATPATIVIHTSAEVAHEWKEWVENEDVRKESGAQDAGGILHAMMKECSSSWGVEHPNSDAKK